MGVLEKVCPNENWGRLPEPLLRTGSPGTQLPHLPTPRVRALFSDILTSHEH